MPPQNTVEYLEYRIDRWCRRKRRQAIWRIVGWIALGILGGVITWWCLTI